MPTLQTIPAEIQVEIISLCDLITKKALRLTCKKLYFAAGVLPLGQVYLAARDRTLSAVQAICNEEIHRTRATGLVIDILMYDENPPQQSGALHALYVAKQHLRKSGQNRWDLRSALMDWRTLYDKQNQCIVVRQGRAPFRDVLLNALSQLENVETISVTDQFCPWYYKEGPLSWDVKSAPFPAASTRSTLGFITMTLMAGLWRTRENRHPKTKSFVAEIFGDPNGLSRIAGLPYDAMFWGVSRLMKNDDSVFRGVFNGFEHISIDISLIRHYEGFGERARSFFASTVKLREKREEWLGIGKMLAGAENLLSLDLRFQDDVLNQEHFEALLGHQHWINLTSLRLFNVSASAETLAQVLENHTNLKTLALIRVGISDDLQTGMGGALTYPIDDLPVWADLAARVGAVLTLESVALFCLLETGVDFIDLRWECRRMPVCRYTDVEEAILSGRVNGWTMQGEYQLRQGMLVCHYPEPDSD